MTEYLLLRCEDVGSRELALRRYLRPVFGPNIRFVADAFARTPQVPRHAAGGTLRMTADWAAARGLRLFEGVGWRCGDYAYYAALDALPDLTRAWLIEGDVRLTFADPVPVFEALGRSEADFLAAALGPRDAGWFWHGLAARGAEGAPVRGCLFPITRMSRAAIAHLGAERAAWARPGHPASRRGPGRPPAVPNDEAFAATILARDGFACRDLGELMPPLALAGDGFSWDAPLLPAEAGRPELAERVLHPVLEGMAAARKLTQLARRSPERFARRRLEVVARAGAEAWAALGALPEARPA